MSRRELVNYFRNSIRFRIFCGLLMALVFGLTLAALTTAAIGATKGTPLRPEFQSALFFFFALLYTTLVFMAGISVILRPITYLSRRLRQLRSRADVRKLNPAEFCELAPLIQTTLDYLEWAENQQTLATAIHHAFRKRIENLAEYDSLTHLYNRYYLQTVLPLQVAHMTTISDVLSLIMLDVDHFKHYNDTNGHPEGDNVLVKVADILRTSVRAQDICCRYGGEEFLIVLPSAPREKARAIAERIRQAIEQTPFKAGHLQPLGRVTASLGVATFPEDATTPDEMIECADQAMYLGKRRGRNRTCSYDLLDVHQMPTIKIHNVEPAS